jgi:hypothetical protein
MKTKIVLIGIAITIATAVFGPGSVLADDLIQANTRHAPSLSQRLRASLFPGFRRPSDTPLIRYFNAEQQQRYAFTKEQEKAVDSSRVDPRTFDGWNTTQPVGNVFKFNF